MSFWQEISDFENKIRSPHRKINTWEYYINFDNLIIPDERLDINYQISVHIEPSKPLWNVGNGIIENVKSIINLIRNREMFNSFSTDVYLWIKAPDQDISFPIILLPPTTP